MTRPDTPGGTLKIAIIGSRDYPQASAVHVKDLLQTLQAQVHEENKIIIGSGGALGVDLWAVALARLVGLPSIQIKPNYPKYGPKIAPLKRNEVLMSWANAVFAFWSESKESTGTIHACKFAFHRPIPVRVFNTQGRELKRNEWYL